MGMLGSQSLVTRVLATASLLATARGLRRRRRDRREPGDHRWLGADLQRSAAGHGGRAVLQDQRLGQPQGDEPLRPVPHGGWAGAAVRAPGRHQPRVRGGQRHRDAWFAARLAPGHQGRRRPQLLARQHRGLRRHPDDLDLELGRCDGRRQRRRRSRGAADPRPGREQELPGRAGPLRQHGPSAARGVLRPLPCAVRGELAVAVLRVGRRRRGLRRRARQDQPRPARAVAPGPAAAQRVPQLLERLRRQLERDGGGDQRVRCVDPAHAGRPVAGAVEGTHAVRRHRRERRQPLQRQRDRPLGVQDRQRPGRLRHQRRRAGAEPQSLG